MNEWFYIALGWSSDFSGFARTNWNKITGYQITARLPSNRPWRSTSTRRIQQWSCCSWNHWWPLVATGGHWPLNFEPPWWCGDNSMVDSLRNHRSMAVTRTLVPWIMEEYNKNITGLTSPDCWSFHLIRSSPCRFSAFNIELKPEELSWKKQIKDMPCDWTRTSCAVWRKLGFYLATGASVCDSQSEFVSENLLKMDIDGHGGCFPHFSPARCRCPVCFRQLPCRFGGSSRRWPMSARVATRWSRWIYNPLRVMISALCLLIRSSIMFYHVLSCSISSILFAGRIRNLWNLVKEDWCPQLRWATACDTLVIDRHRSRSQMFVAA